MREVAITGTGAICALGNDASSISSALKTGTNGIAPITSVDMSILRFSCGAEVRGYNPEQHFPPEQLQLLDRFAQFALVAAREALREAGLEREAAGPRTAVITGTAMGGLATQDAGFQQLYRENRERVHPLTIARTMANAGASHIAMEFGITGPVYTVATACASATHAIGLAFQLVRSGAVDVAIAGGSEAPFTPGMLRAWEAMRVISPDTCRPFSRDRRGMILGEGGAMLVLEAADRAHARGVKVQGRVLGFGMSSDAHHVTQPSAAGPALAMRAALEDAQLRPEQVDHINAHGTGTLANDPTEAAAIHQVFGTHARSVAVTSTKSVHGHALGAAGALEALAALVALRDGVIPATANFTEPDPACDLDVVANEPRRSPVEVALSNSFAFGGLNAVLALGRPLR